MGNVVTANAGAGNVSMTNIGDDADELEADLLDQQHARVFAKHDTAYVGDTTDTMRKMSL